VGAHARSPAYSLADLLIARLAPRARWADRHATDTTYHQPANQPDNRTAAKLTVPSCKLGNVDSITPYKYVT